MFRQESYGVRFEWGPTGAATLATACAALVVVDVLSFTTSVCVAVGRGTRVYPYRWHSSAEEFARSVDAALAVGRRAVSADRPWSLSPAALVRAPFTPRLVLPSPNGSAIAAAAHTASAHAASAHTAAAHANSAHTDSAHTASAHTAGDPVVVAGCLRNAGAVGRFLHARGFGTPDRPVAIIAAGERWPDDTLRPSLEDALGAGAVIEALVRAAGTPTTSPSVGPDRPRDAPGPGLALSPEAAGVRAAYLDAFAAGAAGVGAAVANSISGRELIDGGFGADVEVATELDQSDVVPVLTDGAFTDPR